MKDTMMQYTPHITVAAVIEDAGRFLLVEEHTPQGVKYNQPAGHLEPNESLIEAVIRETLEETAYHFNPTGVLGIYHKMMRESPFHMYVRIAFVGKISYRVERELDEGIIRAAWFDLPTIHTLQPQHRSPFVLTCIDDYLSGQCYSLNLLHYVKG